MTASQVKAYRTDRWRHPLTYARLWVAVHVWALWLPVLARGKDFEPLLRRAAAKRGKSFGVFQAETIARCCRKAVRRPWLMTDRRCLREGLLLHRFLTMAGYRPALHFGVERSSLSTDSLSAHCWVVLPPDRIFNPPEREMVEIFVHPAPV